MLPGQNEGVEETMDYDTTNVPSTYDAGRELSATEKREALRSFAAGISNANIAEIVDLGCGTGRFSEALADTFDANVTGVEPSAKMIAQAHAKYSDERLSFRSGSGEAIPLDAQTSDMIFMSMILHHECECKICSKLPKSVPGY